MTIPTLLLVLQTTFNIVAHEVYHRCQAVVKKPGIVSIDVVFLQQDGQATDAIHCKPLAKPGDVCTATTSKLGVTTCRAEWDGDPDAVEIK